jgi:hypothetical protein
MTSLAALRDRFAVASAGERVLPMHPALGGLLPDAQRGTVVGCSGGAAVSLALTVVAQPSADGVWVCVVGLPTLGAAAAIEHGVALERTVVVAEPSTGSEVRWDDSRWGEVLAAAIDGFDVVLLGPAVHRLRVGTARRLQARAQARGAVLVVVHPERGAFGADVVLRTESVHWHGLGQGHGVVQQRRTEVTAAGRRMPRERRSTIVWPLSSAPDERSTGHVVPGDVVPMRRTG